MRKLLLLIMFGSLILGQSVLCSEESEKEANKNQKESTSPDVYYLQIRVIYAGKTGIYGDVPRELSDMYKLLTRSFEYPSYELSNRIRLSLFSDEDITALVFPEHYLHLIPRGSTDSGESLKLKAELYHFPENRNQKARVDVLDPPKIVRLKEKLKSDRKRHDFPIMSSALLVNFKDWEAFGGVPVRVNSQGRVSSSRMSTSTFGTRQNSALGERKYLILGIRLEDR